MGEETSSKWNPRTLKSSQKKSHDHEMTAKAHVNRISLLSYLIE